jgi:hypothetical protein
VATFSVTCLKSSEVNLNLLFGFFSSSTYTSGFIHYTLNTKYMISAFWKLWLSFLAHLSTKCSRWAFVTTICPGSLSACVDLCDRRQHLCKHLFRNHWAKFDEVLLTLFKKTSSLKVPGIELRNFVCSIVSLNS